MSGIRVAQVGCGYWGKNLARNFAELGALVAVVDGDAATARVVAEQNGVPVRDFQAVLDDPEINGVVLATPAPLHAGMALEAIAAGKHVFVEKPLALRPGDAHRMIAAATRAGRCLMVGHLLQYHPVFVRVREIVASGGLGRLHYVYSNRLSLGKFRAEENVLWSFAPHDVSMILALVGEEPVSVTAQGAAFITPGIADWVTCQMQFANGTSAHLTTSWLHPFKEHRLLVVGSEGMIVFEDSLSQWDRKLAIYRHSVESGGSAPVPKKADAQYVEVAAGEPLRAECQQFLRSIETGENPLTDGAEGLRVLNVLDQAEAKLSESLGDSRS